MNILLLASLIGGLFQNPQPPAPPQILDADFPLAKNIVPGRWFPFGVRLKSEKAWQGTLSAQANEKGPIFKKNVRLEPGKESVELIPVLLGPSDSQIALELDSSEEQFLVPARASKPQLLLVGAPSALEEMKRLAVEGFGLPQELADTAESVEAKDLPRDLFLLDAIDYLLLHEEAAASMEGVSKDCLLRWAALRGRLFCSEAARAKLVKDAAFLPLIETPGQTERRNLPRLYLPPDSSPELLPRDFARPWEPASFFLLLYLAAGGFLIFRIKEGEKILSRLVFCAGLAAVVQAIPGLSWPSKTPSWRCLVGREDSPVFLLEERAYGRGRSISVNPSECLVFPKQGSRFVVEWGAQAAFSDLRGELKVQSVLPLPERKLDHAAGGFLRNSFASLKEISWTSKSSPWIGFQEELPLGELLPQEPREKGRLPSRPLADFRAADWVGAEWLSARVSDRRIPLEGALLGAEEDATYLLWFPKSH